MIAMKNKFKSLNNYLVTVDNSFDGILKKKYGSFEYLAPETADRDKFVFPQVGEIYNVPTKNPLGLKVGDKVVCNHSIMNNLIEGDIYFLEDAFFIAKIDEEEGFIMLNNKVLIDKIVEEKKIGSIFLPEKENKEECFVRFAPNGSHLKVGQKIGIIEDQFYSFYVEDKMYHVIDEKMQILFYYEGDVMHPIQSFVKIASGDMFEDVEYKGIKMPRHKMNSLTTGYQLGVVSELHSSFDFEITQNTINGVVVDIKPSAFEFGNRDKTKANLESGQLAVGDTVLFEPRPDRMRYEGKQLYYFARVEEYDEVKCIIKN